MYEHKFVLKCYKTILVVFHLNPTSPRGLQQPPNEFSPRAQKRAAKG